MRTYSNIADIIQVLQEVLPMLWPHLLCCLNSHFSYFFLHKLLFSCHRILHLNNHIIICCQSSNIDWVRGASGYTHHKTVQTGCRYTRTTKTINPCTHPCSNSILSLPDCANFWCSAASTNSTPIFPVCILKSKDQY